MFSSEIGCWEGLGSQTVAIVAESISVKAALNCERSSLVMVPAPRRQEFKCLLFLRVTFPNSEVLLSVCDHCSAAWRVYRAWAFLLLVILGPFFLSCIRKNLHWFFYLLIYLTFLFKMKPHIRRRIFCEKCPVCLLFGILLKWIKSILNLPTEWFDYALTQVCITFEDSKYD